MSCRRGQRFPTRASALLRRRLTAQGLAGPPLGTGRDGPLAVARRLLATQAQDPRGFRLAIRARTRASTGADVDRALTEERSLSRAALRERLLAAGVPADGQGLVHVLFRASLDGVLVRGPVAEASLAGSGVALAPFDELPESVMSALERDGAAVAQFLGR